MGMYTGLRIKVTVKEEYRLMIEDINDGARWRDYVIDFPFLSDYSQQGKAEFIPSGMLCYMPNSWEEGKFPNQLPTDGFDRNIDMQTGEWTFQCSLKNYNSEIEQFLNEVLVNIIADAKHIEYFYEDYKVSRMFDFIDGKIIENHSGGIRYESDYGWF